MDRPERSCDVCGQVDDHPRHVQQLRGRAVARHLDCCAVQGCDVCAATEKVTKGKRGSELLAVIQAGATEGIG